MITRMKRGTVAVSVVALATASFSGCSSMTNTGQSNGVCEAPAVNADATAFSGSPAGDITFQTTNLKKDFAGFFEPLIASFEKEHPDINVTWIDDPGDGDFTARMLAQARACDLPDVMNLNISTVTGLNDASQLLDFDKKVADAGAPFVPSIWDSLTAQSGTASHPALPWYWSPSVLTFNTELMEKSGLDPQSPPATMTELFEDAQQVAKTSGGKYFALNGNPSWDYLTDWQTSGVALMNSDHTEFTFGDDPAALAYVTGYADAYAAGAIPPDSVNGSPDATEAYSAGQLVFGSRNASFLRYLRDNAPKIYPLTEVAAAPSDPGQSTPFVGQYISVSNTSENAHAAAVFAQYLTNDANQLAWAKDPSVVVFPSTSQALEDPFFTEPAADDTLSQARAIAAQAALEATFDPAQMYFGGSVDSEIVKQLQLAFTGAVSPADALQAAEDSANKALNN